MGIYGRAQERLNFGQKETKKSRMLKGDTV